MDIFTILVFFLLVNSSDVEVLQSNKDITLPTSVAEKQPENQLVVMVSEEDIIVGGRKVTTIKSVLRLEDNDIPELQKELKYLAERKPYQNVEEQQKGRSVTIMGDEDIPYKVLKKIMSTCAKTEYRNISLAVSQVSGDAEPAAGAGG